RAAVGAGHLGQAGGGAALALRVLLEEVVLAVPAVARLALHQRVDERLDVAGRRPDLARQDHRRVQADDVLAAGDHRTPPLALDVLLQLDAERTVVPGRLRAAVDLPAGVDEPPPLAEIDDG